jgi:polar amino acid transport system substrate-binding protein
MTLFRTLSRIGAALASAVILTGAPPTKSEENKAQVTKTTELRIAVQTSNPVLAIRRSDGQYTGVGIDVATALGKTLGKPAKLVFYPDIVHFNQSIGKDEWDAAISPRDLSRAGQLAFSHPFLEVDTSYIARPGSQIRTPEEVDRSGVRVGVAQPSAAYGFLTRTLRQAQIVRIYGGLVEAKQALSNGRIDVYADYAPVNYRIALEVPGANVLVSRLNVMRMTIALPKSNAAALDGVNDFIKDAKRDGLITDAINRAGFHGVRTAR